MIFEQSGHLPAAMLGRQVVAVDFLLLVVLLLLL